MFFICKSDSNATQKKNDEPFLDIFFVAVLIRLVVPVSSSNNIRKVTTAAKAKTRA